jgi:small neutral amino acid transporter SnatA (MarC family)
MLETPRRWMIFLVVAVIACLLAIAMRYSQFIADQIGNSTEDVVLTVLVSSAVVIAVMITVHLTFDRDKTGSN